MTEARRRIGARVALAALALALQACGPGSGGTGLPPGDSASSVPVSAPPPPSATRVPASGLPERAPELSGPLERVDADSLTLAGVVLPRASVALLDAAGAPLAAEAARPGLAARAWRVGDGWLVALGD